jgi:hypothetical protein
MRRIAILGFLLFASARAWAQLPPAQVVQAPNVASLGTFGTIPVSHATGTPDISIPLYTITSGKIQIPLTMRYHQSSVRPNEHPGWVGLGWSFVPGGSITRVQNGAIDEYENNGNNHSYHTTGRFEIAVADWESEDKLKTFFSAPNGRIVDTEPDEFSFNFLGYSGRFYYTATGWKAISDKDVKVEMLSFLNKENIASRIKANLPGFNYLDPVLFDQARQYYQFKLTTEDGTQYIFGGRDLGNEDAVDFTTGYDRSIRGYMINAWHLVKIIQPNNVTIDFKYHRKYPIASLAFNTSWFDGSGSGDNLPCSGFWAQNVTTTQHGGTAIFPAYLDEIVWQHGSVKFFTSYSTELRYSDYFFQYFVDGIYEQQINAQWLISNASPGPDYNNIKWEQLDRFEVRRSTGEVVSKHTFSYSASSSQRLTLNSLRERNASDAENKVYSFGYNNVSALPPYGGDQTDHWGYYNGRSVNGISFAELETSSNPSKNKKPNTSVATTGLLNRITYPTGGYTEFDWESHSYGKVLATSKQALDAENGTGGGCRIKEIRSYASATATPITRTYYYVLNYNGNATGLTSSGQLSGRPQYFVHVSNRPTAFYNNQVTYSYGNVSNRTNYGVFAQGVPLGYTEVIEKNGDNSYTKFIYTGYDTDINGVSHFDKPSATVGWLPGEDRFIPFASVAEERGKLLQATQYTSSGIPVERKHYTYNDDPNRFNTFIKTTNLHATPGCWAVDGLILGAAVKQFTFSYYVKSETLTKYSPDQTAFPTTTNYTYNPMGMLASKSFVQSDGSTLQSHYKYPSDYDNSVYVTGCQNANTSCRANVDLQTQQCYANCNGNTSCMSGCESARSGMLGQCEATYQQCLNAYPTSNRIIELKDQHIYNAVIEEQQRLLYAGGTTPYLVGGNLTLYKKNSGLLVPSDVYSIELSTPVANPAMSTITNAGAFTYHGNYALKATLDSYDNAGNVLQYHKTDGINVSYLWGHQNSFPVAEAQNATSNAIFFDSFEEGQGWDSNLTQYDASTAHNGKFSGKIEKLTAGEQYSHSTKWLTVYSPVPVKYKYSAWVYSNGPSVDLYLFMKTSSESGYYTYVDNVRTTTIGKWILLEKEFVVPANITRLNIRIDNNGGGTVWFDDVRLHPDSAKVTTYTFDPIIGLTSSTDENNNSLLYEYDTFNRLKLVRDQDKKILKQYTYHYQNQN